VEAIGASSRCQEGEEKRCGVDTYIASLRVQVPAQGYGYWAAAKDNKIIRDFKYKQRTIDRKTF